LVPCVKGKTVCGKMVTTLGFPETPTVAEFWEAEDEVGPPFLFWVLKANHI
jgi:hypothetical protein